eukprot:3100109-Pleurochrysis_carterae.AAC.4
MHETGELDLPPNCHYPDLEVVRLKGTAVKALEEMKYAGFPLCPGLLALAGESQSSQTIKAEQTAEREERAKAT